MFKQEGSKIAMEMLRHLLFTYLCIVAHTIRVHAQLQAGFISLDCGISEDSDYTDQKTNINYVSDESFIETGVTKKVSPEYVTETSDRQFLNLRSFPEGTKNCYSIKLSRNYDKFFVRARFLYGNYDGQNKPPKFDLLLEADKWDSVEFKDASTIVTKEVIHAPQRNYIFVCLVNTGSGTPFMSTLEFRPLRNLTYQTQSGSLQLFGRFDVGSRSNETIRYEDDNYDRIWFPFSFDNWAPINSSLTVGYSKSDYQLPSSVMSTAVIPANDSNSIEFFWEPPDPKSQYYIYLHFAEIADARANNQTRELNISLNGNLWYGPFVPDYLYTSTIFSVSPISGDVIQFSIAKTVNSTLPPILNALEIYQIKEFMQSLTKQQDVDAIMNVKSDYNLKRNWQGDPCAPTVHMWQGLNCSYNGTESPRIISLNLSSSGLTREISAYISNLTSIRILDLSKNNLTGQVPEFLAKLPFLSVLDLKGNKLEGPIPAGLLIKKKNGQLSLSVDPDLCSSSSCTEQHKHIVPIVAAFGSLSVLLTAIAVFWILKKRKQEDKWWLSILIVIGVALLVPLLFYLCYLIWRKLKAKVDVTMNRKKLLRELEDDVSSLNTNGKGVTQEKDQSMKHELKIFNFQTIVAATNNFSTANELGKGGFGPVYKGKLLDGEEIAIKRLSKSSGQGVEEFKNEAKLIAKLQHTNLVRLLGCSLQGEERILVYEYMPNKSLDFFIFDSKRKNLLNWKKRFNIIEGIAQGLLYLHKYSRLRVIHRDLKASNILLDDQMNPKISDFGMARIFRVNESEANTNRIVGTYGYMSPEYAMNGIVSIKTDVFSLGVLVLEIVSGKKNNSCYHIRHPLNLVGYAWQLVNEGKGLELKDPTMDEACSPSEVLRCIHVGLLCVQDQATDRPTMSDVVSMLTNEAVTLPAPKQPAFFVNVTAEEPEISRNRLDSCSVNDVTISAMKAR